MRGIEKYDPERGAFRTWLYAVADPMNTNGLLFLWWLDRNNPEDRKAVKAALEGWPLWAWYSRTTRPSRPWYAS